MVAPDGVSDGATVGAAAGADPVDDAFCPAIARVARITIAGNILFTSDEPL
jgi:hypothetical protein